MKTLITIFIIAVAIGYFIQKPNPPAPVGQIKQNVVIKNFSFDQKSITVKRGSTVIWANSDSAPHTITSDTGETLASPTLNKDGTFSFTFNTAGTFKYHCSFHPSMKGTIIVTQ